MELRVAAYCRVSTDREDQANSLRSQQSYFTSYIEGHPGWTLAEVYADEGLSGTSTRKREAFNRMISDAQEGKFHLILTKEVSRFARNTVDTLEYTRRLKTLGVGVIFISDSIDTRDNDGELRLTIMASMAQEESRKTSQRVKWGQKRRMEAGVVFGNNSIYGFDIKAGKLYLKEDEAAVIRRVYHKFLDEGKGTHVIARELYEEGVPPPRSATGRWSCVMVRRVLRNEKYVGDLLQKKFVTTDYLTHQKVENRGQEEQVYLKDHHQAIVGRATWEAVQEELARRGGQQAEKSKYSNRYWCSGKIRCGACASRFVPRTTKRKNGDLYKIWGCHSRVHYGNRKQNSQGDWVGCDMGMVNHKVLTACAQHVLEQLDLDYDAIITELTADIRRVRHHRAVSPDPERLKAHQAQLQQKKERAMDAYFSRTISKEELLGMKAKYDEELERLELQLGRAAEAQRLHEEQAQGLEDLAQTLRENVTCWEEVFAETVERVTVCDAHITFQLRFLPVLFQLRYQTSGRRADYTVTITDCKQYPIAPDALDSSCADIRVV